MNTPASQQLALPTSIPFTLTTLFLLTIFLTLVLPFEISRSNPNISKAQKILEKAPDNIQAIINQAPSVYEFPSQFREEESSVSFAGQVFRNILIHDLKLFMNSLKRRDSHGSNRDAMYALNSYLKFRSLAPTKVHGSINGQSHHQVKLKNLNEKEMQALEGKTYNNLGAPNKNLWSKIAGNDNPLNHGTLRGWKTESLYGTNLSEVNADRKDDPFVEPEDFIQALFQALAKNATHSPSFTVPLPTNPWVGRRRPLEEQVNEAGTTEDGLDLSAMIHSFLQMSVAFSQASGDYLSTHLGPEKGLRADNIVPYKSTKNHTTLEHHWDEAFGYLGVPRDFALYTDEQIAHREGISKDSNNDGKISIMREKIIGDVAEAMGHLDLRVKHLGDGTLDLSRDVMKAFIAGRELIRQKPTGYRKYVRAYGEIAINLWEKAIAAIVIHNINNTLQEMNAYEAGNYSFKRHAKYWSAMKGYALGFQFNPISQVNVNDFNTFHKLVGDKPSLMKSPHKEIENYKKNLLKARQILKEAFGFSQINTDIL